MKILNKFKNQIGCVFLIEEMTETSFVYHVKVRAKTLDMKYKATREIINRNDANDIYNGVLAMLSNIYAHEQNYANMIDSVLNGCMEDE